jgi:hypothetical protein
MHFPAQARLSISRGDPMQQPKLKDLITMLDFFDPELPVFVVTDVKDVPDLRLIVKVQLVEGDEPYIALRAERRGET